MRLYASLLQEQEVHQGSSGLQARVASSKSGYRYDDQASGATLYMQQRYYDPIAGRFLSVDPVTTNAKTGEHFNRYAYANNSPYTHVDPDGRFGIPGAITGALVEAGMQLATTGSISDGKAVAVAAVAGFVTGGLAGNIAKAALGGTISAGGAVAKTAAVGAAVGAAGSAANDALGGKAPDAAKMAVNAVGGAAGAAAGAKISNAAANTLESMSSAGGVMSHVAETTRASMNGTATQVGSTAGQEVGKAIAEVGAAAATKNIEKKVAE